MGTITVMEPIRIRPDIKGIQCVQEGAMELGAWWEEPNVNRLWFRIPWEDKSVMATSTHLLILENIPDEIESVMSVGDGGLWCWLVAAAHKTAIDEGDIPEYVADTRIVSPANKFRERVKRGFIEIPDSDVVIVSNLGSWHYGWFERHAKKRIIVYSLGSLMFLKARGYEVKGLETKFGPEFVAWR